MSASFRPIFERLRGILSRHAGTFSVKSDGSKYYGLEAGVGPAAVRAWRGEMRRPMLPVAWVTIGKSYVSYHLMGLDGNPRLLADLSTELKVRMQGKTCFNFKTEDDLLFRELEQVTARALDSLKKSGFISESGLSDGA